MSNYLDSKQEPIKANWLKIIWMMYVLFPFNLKGISTFQTGVYYLLSVVFLFIVANKVLFGSNDKSYSINLFLFMFIIIILSFLAWIIPIIKNTNDFSYFNYYVYNLGRIAILTGTVVLVKNVYQYINLMINAINLYVICSIILLIPKYHYLYQSLLQINTSTALRMEELFSQTYYTRFGLQGFSGFGSTTMCTISVMLICIMIVNAVKNNESYKSYVIKLLISLVGNSLYGRIGLIISIVLVVFTVLYLTIIYKKINLFFSLIISMLLLIILFVLNANKLQQISSINWMFEGFFNYLNTGHFSTSSTNQLAKMYIKPNRNTFWYGDGLYTTMGMYYMKTDVGFLRPLLFWGIWGEILYYLLLLPILFSLLKIFNNQNKFLITCLILILIIMFEFKGETLLVLATTLYPIVLKKYLEGDTSNA